MRQDLEKALCAGGALTTAFLAMPAWYASCTMVNIAKPAKPLVAMVAAASILTTTSAFLYSQRKPWHNRDATVSASGCLSSSGVFCLSTWRATQNVRQAFNAQSLRLAGNALPSVAGMFVGATCVSACLGRL